MMQCARILPNTGARPKLARKPPKIVVRKNNDSLKREEVGIRTKFILGQSYIAPVVLTN